MVKIRKSNLLVGLATLMLCRPAIIMQYPSLDHVVSLLVNGILLLTFVYWIMTGMKMDSWVIQTGLFFLTLFVITTFRGGTLSNKLEPLKNFVSVLIWFLVFRKSRGRFIDLVKYVLFALVLLNLATLILFPNGMIQLQRVENEWNQYQVGWWLFGNKNSMLMWIFALNILAHISLYDKGKRGKLISFDSFMILCTVLTAFLCKSSTTIVVIVLITVLPLLRGFFQWKWTEKLFSQKGILIFYIVFTILLITSSQLGIFEFVSGIFGKDVTFTGRTSAWAQSLVLIAKRPIIGYGILQSQSLQKLLGAFAFVNAHNTLLQSFFDGGVILGVQYLVIIYFVCKKIKNMETKKVIQKNFLMFSMLLLMIAISFEAYTDSLMFWNFLSLIVYSVKSIEEKTYNEEVN